jgi:hypothetical protein
MKQLYRLLVSLVVPAFVLAVVGTNPAFAQDKAKDAKAAPAAKGATAGQSKIVFENDKVRVTESRWAPGSEAPSVLRPGRIVHTIKGGTLLRTYPDGKQVKVETKTGETRWVDAETFSFKNVGKTEVVLYSVALLK